MADRDPDVQSIHDAVVERLATKLSDNNKRVRADVAGFETPAQVRGHVPDISVGSLPTRILEVETDASDDAAQRRAFKDWAQQKSARNYRGILATSPTEYEEFERGQEHI